jgi:hypothetical protein
MGVPERSNEWESPTLDTGPSTDMQGCSLKTLGPEVPVVVLCYDLLIYFTYKLYPQPYGDILVGPRSMISKTQEDGWAYLMEKLYG